MTDKDYRASLRRELRARRRGIPAAEAEAAAARLCRRVAAEDFFQRAATIAFYGAMDGEVDPRPLLLQALQDGKRGYLPFIRAAGATKNDCLAFAQVTAATPLQPGPWGAPQPSTENLLPPADLDLVLLPLVAFDARCNRLGMGKGFYDRTFAFKSRDAGSTDYIDGPFLAGLAHECQRLDQVPAAPWDVPLNAVVTDQRVYRPPAAYQS